MLLKYQPVKNKYNGGLDAVKTLTSFFFLKLEEWFQISHGYRVRPCLKKNKKFFFKKIKRCLFGLISVLTWKVKSNVRGAVIYNSDGNVGLAWERSLEDIAHK